MKSHNTHNTDSKTDSKTDYVERLSWSSKSSLPRTKELMRAHTEKVLEADKRGEYLEPYPIEMRREFWKYALNPITGMPTPLLIDPETLKKTRERAKEKTRLKNSVNNEQVS